MNSVCKIGGPSLAVLLIISTGCARDSALMRSNNHLPQVAAPLTFGHLSEQQGDLAQARSFYLEAAQQSGTQAQALHRLAVLSDRTGEHEQAEDYYLQARQLDPNDAGLLNDLGYFYSRRGRLDEAEHTLRSALRNDPNHKRAMNNLGLVLGQQGRLQESYQLFRRALGEARAYANLAYLHTQRGELGVAENLYRQALALDPSLEAAADALVELAEYQEVRAVRNPRTASFAPMPQVGSPHQNASETKGVALVSFGEGPRPPSGASRQLENKHSPADEDEVPARTDESGWRPRTGRQ